jgi:hypothetical protein
MRNVLWLGPLAVVLVIALAVQAASVALFGSLGSLPSFARIAASDWPFAAAAATGADRLPAVRIELARAALLHGEADRAAELVAGLAPSSTVADLRGQVALAHGRSAEAVADFGTAGDVVRAEAAIAALDATDPLEAYTLSAAFAADAVRRHAPAAVRGAAAWHAGQRAAMLGYKIPAQTAAYNALALAHYRDAVRDDPTQEAYLLAEGFGALATGDLRGSRGAYRAAVAVVPDSVDGYLGLEASNARLGDCVAARAASARALTFAAHQGRSLTSAGAGYDAATRAAIDRCTH